MSPERRTQRRETVWVTVNEGRRVFHGDAWHYPGDTFPVAAQEAEGLLENGDVHEHEPE